MLKKLFGAKRRRAAQEATGDTATVERRKQQRRDPKAATEGLVIPSRDRRRGPGRRSTD